MKSIIELAKQAGLTVGTNISGVTLVGSPAEIGLAHIDIDEMQRFATLVRAQVLEEAAGVCEEVCDDPHVVLHVGTVCAAAIRALISTQGAHMTNPAIEYRARVMQFTEADALDVIARHHQGCGDLVDLTQRAGSLNFQFSMTPAQARELAAHLIEGARVLEGSAA